MHCAQRLELGGPLVTDYCPGGIGLRPIRPGSHHPAEEDRLISIGRGDHYIDLIVICSHGYSWPRRWVLGSVADTVLRGADVPVLLVRTYPQQKNYESR
jgi:hypothetical protein